MEPALPRATLLLAALASCLTTLAGCRETAARPLSPHFWREDLSPPPRRLPFLVTVFQLSQEDSRYVNLGSGSIVHSCAEHGTYVLTAYNCTNEESAIGVWAYGFGRLQPRAEPDSLLSYRAERVHPLFKDQVQDVFGDFIRSLEDVDSIHRRDFAILKLDTLDLFQTVPIAAVAESGPAPGTPVELAALQPENYPHSHHFSWGPAFTDEVFRHGHSGGPILNQGSLVAIIASQKAFPGAAAIPHQAPTTATIKKALAEAGLGFLLEPGGCTSKVTP
jgi:hypothetical protein